MQGSRTFFDNLAVLVTKTTVFYQRKFGCWAFYQYADSNTAESRTWQHRAPSSSGWTATGKPQGQRANPRLRRVHDETERVGDKGKEKNKTKHSCQMTHSGENADPRTRGQKKLGSGGHKHQTFPFFQWFYDVSTIYFVCSSNIYWMDCFKLLKQFLTCLAWLKSCSRTSCLAQTNKTGLESSSSEWVLSWIRLFSNGLNAPGRLWQPHFIQALCETMRHITSSAEKHCSWLQKLTTSWAGISAGGEKEGCSQLPCTYPAKRVRQFLLNQIFPAWNTLSVILWCIVGEIDPCLAASTRIGN